MTGSIGRRFRDRFYLCRPVHLVGASLEGVSISWERVRFLHRALFLWGDGFFRFYILLKRHRLLRIIPNFRGVEQERIGRKALLTPIKAMAEFWEENFKDKGKMWGMAPARSAILTRDFFLEQGVKEVFVPGMGYGRNAQVFAENGMQVSGVEISRTAIDLAHQHYGSDMKIYHGSVSDMPFDDTTYDGIFCHALIHLLDRKERQKLIRDCHAQLASGGYMVFTAITKEAPNFGKGQAVGDGRYEFHQGVRLFFYDRDAVMSEFGEYGLLEIREVDEDQPMYLIKCKKGRTG